MNTKTMKGLLLIVLMATAGLAGCIGDEDEDEKESSVPSMDASDGGYRKYVGLGLLPTVCGPAGKRGFLLVGKS